ncbi:MAG TPA: universal stress protein [Gemmatimonadaceae bacterium]|nr:universal stress protein [Gemmatimonadaceae bacterium]
MARTPKPNRTVSDRTPTAQPLPGLRSIVVPLDGSELSESALPMALSLARMSGATVYAVHVLVPAPLDTHVPGLFDTARNVNQAFEQQARDYLKEVERRHAGAAGTPLVVELLGSHAPNDSLGDTRSVVAALGGAVQRRKPDLIVMTSHGGGGASRVWLGSVADDVIRRSGVPVLLVHAEAPAASTLFTHILVPLDGSGLSEQVLPIARVLASQSGARLTLLRVLIPLQAVARPAPVARVDKEDLARKRVDAEEYFRRIRASFDLAANTLDTALVVDKNPGRAIIDFADTHQVDLIAMTTQGLGGVKRLLIGSTADKIVRGSRGNVLVYRGTAEARRGGGR